MFNVFTLAAAPFAGLPHTVGKGLRQACLGT